jgi:hypothetical protein
MVPRTSYALSARHLQYMNDDTRAANAAEVHSKRVSRAAGAASRVPPTQMLYTRCALHVRDIRVANAL